MPLFRSKKDIQYVARITQELIERVIGEKFTYYAISEKFTETNFYNEAVSKVFDPPLAVFGLIEWKDQETSTDEAGQDIIYNITIFLSETTLKKINLTPIEGDMVDYDDKKFEIVNITEPTQIFGKAGATMGKVLECRSVRASSFTVSISGVVEYPARTRPDEDYRPEYGEVRFPYSGSSDV